MKKKISVEQYKKSLEDFLVKEGLKVVYYKNLRHDKEDFFIKTPPMHYLVMAFNWALVPCKDMRKDQSKPRKKSYEFDWKQIDLLWRKAIKELEGTAE